MESAYDFNLMWKIYFDSIIWFVKGNRKLSRLFFSSISSSTSSSDFYRCRYSRSAMLQSPSVRVSVSCTVMSATLRNVVACGRRKTTTTTGKIPRRFPATPARVSAAAVEGMWEGILMFYRHHSSDCDLQKSFENRNTEESAECCELAESNLQFCSPYYCRISHSNLDYLELFCLFPASSSAHLAKLKIQFVSLISWGCSIYAK